MFLALLLLTLTSGNDLAARRKAALKAIIVPGGATQAAGLYQRSGGVPYLVVNHAGPAREADHQRHFAAVEIS